MANTKMTKREMFEALKAKYDFDEVEVAFIDHEIDLLARKNSGEKKPTPTQVANEGIKDEILAILDKPMTVTEIAKALAEDYANQKVSALVRQLVSDNKVVRT